MLQVIGHTQCEVCDTDKWWTFMVDSNARIPLNECVKRQNDEVVEPKHVGHIDRLVRHYTVKNNEKVISERKYEPVGHIRSICRGGTCSETGKFN